jgi:hypothetical protein
VQWRPSISVDGIQLGSMCDEESDDLRVAVFGRVMKKRPIHFGVSAVNIATCVEIPLNILNAQAAGREMFDDFLECHGAKVF